MFRGRMGVRYGVPLPAHAPFSYKYDNVLYHKGLLHQWQGH